MMKAEGVVLSAEERKELFNKIDRDKDHKIEFKVTAPSSPNHSAAHLN